MAIVGLIIVLIINNYVRSETNTSIYYQPDRIPREDVGIIFGAGIRNDQPTKYLKDRLDAGIVLYKLKKIDKILLSGDNGSVEHDELTVMKLYCFEHGVDTSKVFLDYAGFDTYSTLYRAKHIFKIHRAILVSQEYHLNRAIYVGNKLGVQSVGLAANAGEYSNYNYVRFREYFTICKSVFDLIRNREPHLLGQEVNINGISNYNKDDKR